MKDWTVIASEYGQGAVYCLVAFIFIVIVKILADKRTVAFDDDEEIEEHSNAAVGFRRTGLYLGYAIALTGSLGGTSLGFVNDLQILLIDSVLIAICLFGCREINDRIMLPDTDNDDQALSGNTAVGLAELGMHIGTGLILNGAFSGGGTDMFTGILSALLFFVIGQVCLIACGLFYQAIISFDVRSEIHSGNPAAGLALAGILIAFSIILRASIAGPFNGWLVDIISFGISAVFGMILLFIFVKLSDRFLLPHTSIVIEVARDRNIAALAVIQGVLLAVALVIGTVI